MIRVGDQAPDFAVRAVEDGGVMTLTDFRGHQGLLLGLYRGLHCPFCRRHLAQLGLVAKKLRPLGLATVAIVNTRGRGRDSTSAAARPVCASAPIPSAASTTRTPYRKSQSSPRKGAQQPWPAQTTIEEFLESRINPTGEMPTAVDPIKSNDVLNARDGFHLTSSDAEIRARQGTQLVGLFLIDADGVVRWRYVEAEATPNDIGRLPGLAEIAGAASNLTAD